MSDRMKAQSSSIVCLIGFTFLSRSNNPSMRRSRVVRHLKKLPQNNFNCKILGKEKKGSLFVFLFNMPSAVEKNLEATEDMCDD